MHTNPREYKMNNAENQSSLTDSRGTANDYHPE